MSIAADQRVLTYAGALLEATSQEMARDPSVFVMGLGVDDPKGMYGTTKDLHNIFGADRNFDTPLAEDAMTGVAIGAALAGMRPIHVHQRMDFLLLCMNQLVNIAAKSSYMFAGQVSVPLVVRAVVGRSWGQGAQHSQAFHSYFMHVPGIKIAAPATPHDAKGCLVAAIRDNNPVVFMEHRMLYGIEGIVPMDLYEVPFGTARVMARGADVTVVGVSHMVVECMRAQRLAQAVGISLEIIDPITLTPIDIETIGDSVNRTGRLLIVDNGWETCGFGSELVTQIVERFPGRGITIKRMGYLPTPCPTTKPLEDIYYPTARSIADAAAALTGRSDTIDWPPSPRASELDEFRGPF